MVGEARKSAFITGASSGLGAEYARQLGKQGYDLILTARRGELMQLLAESIRANSSVEVTVLPADLSKMEDIERLVSIISATPNLEMLVNDAGFATSGRFHAVDPAKELAMLYVHMIAPVMLCRAALPAMLNHNEGTIINVSSLSGLIPIRNVVYQSTKAFLVNFSFALKQELAGSNVHVQVLCPGFVYAGFHDTDEFTHFSRSSVPKFLWMRSEQVVSESLQSLSRHRLICIPGAIYKIAGALARNSLTAGLLRATIRLILRKRRTFINT